MKLVYAAGIVAALASASLGIAACSDETTTNNTGGDAGKDTGTGSDSSTGNDSGQQQDGGKDSAAPGNCADYCAKVTANCTQNFAQYNTEAECLKTCALFPLGTTADTSGHTVGCRTYHANAVTTGGPAVHCPHAGPSGGAVCGTRCEALCDIATGGACAADSGVDGGPPYADKAACLTACAAYPVSDAGEKQQAGNTVNCRIYHGVVAQSNPPTSANTHCGHTGQTGGPCQ